MILHLAERISPFAVDGCESCREHLGKLGELRAAVPRHTDVVYVLLNNWERHYHFAHLWQHVEGAGSAFANITGQLVFSEIRDAFRREWEGQPLVEPLPTDDVVSF